MTSGDHRSGTNSEVITMKRPTQSIWFWTPRILLALLWIVYVYPFVHGVFAFPDFWREGLIGVVISIALGGVLLGALALAIEVVQQERLAGAMRRPVRRLLFWTPRVALLLFAAFLSIFALDVFGAGYGFWETALALLMHLIPMWIMLGALALAWRWEWVGLSS